MPESTDTPPPDARRHASAMDARLRAALSERYQIVRELGRGGMGRVYLALDPRHGRDVAIKVLHPELATELGSERFLREIRTAAKLNHPQILPMHDSGEAEGLLYYTMPFVEGESLRERLRRDGRMEVRDAVELVRQLADGLEYAHAQGVVHRDVKPENVLLPTPTHAVLADFGLARAIYSAAQGRITPTGMVVGSPLYMSPEQASGEHRVDGRADVYSLGCVLFEMLAGVPPFRGPSAQAVLKSKLSNSPPSVRALRPDLPPALAAAVEKAMRRDPGERYASAADFRRAVLQAVEPRRARRRWAVAAGAAAGILGLLAVALLIRPADSLIASGRLAANEPILVAPFQPLVAADSSIADMATLLLETGLSESRVVALVSDTRIADALQRMQRPEVQRLDPELAREVALREGIPAVVTGRVVSAGAGFTLTGQIIAPDSGTILASVQATAADSAELFSAVDRLVRELRTAIGESFAMLRRSEPLAQVTTGSLEALRKYTQGIHAVNEQQNALAISLFEEAVALDPEFAMAYRALGIALANQGGEWARALAMLRRAYELRARLTDVERLHTTGVYHTAIDEYDEAALAYQTLLGEHPNDARALTNLGFVYSQLGAEEQAIPYYARALALEGVPLHFTNLYEAQVNAGRVAEAVETFQTFAARHPENPRRYRDAAVFAATAGDYTAAERLFREYEARFRGEAGRAIEAEAALRDLAAVRGHLRQAEERGLAVMRQELARNRPAGYLRAAVQLSMLDIVAREDPTRGRSRVEEALAEVPVTSLPWDNRPYERLAWLYALSGDAARARTVLEEHRATADPLQPRVVAGERHAITAAVALAEGRPQEALRELAAIPPSVCTICRLPRLAAAYEAAGQPDSAIAAYERYLATPYFERLPLDAVWLPHARRRLVELYRAAGNAPEANEHLRAWEELWREADPELRGRVEEALSRAGAATTPARPADRP